MSVGDRTSDQEFRCRWVGYVDELDRLKWNLPEDRHYEVDKLKDELEDLIEEAIEHR